MRQDGATSTPPRTAGDGGRPQPNFAAGDDFKELVRSHTDLPSLIGEKVALTPMRGGREYKGLCPFHDDRNPSFTVSPERGTYRCWACQEGGDCFSFVMKTEKLDFREALEFLARRAGLEIPQFGRRNNGPKRDETLASLKWAGEQFASAMHQDETGRAAREYFEGRGFSQQTVATFGLGFHPRNWTYLIDRARGNFELTVLEAARLAKKSERTGDWIDAFVGRVMFPIRNERGDVVAFGGRVLPGQDDDRGPKYLNSADSPYFSKQKILFGLDVARDAVGEAGCAVVVEGYTDCITLHQYGIGNAVGVLGTALTDSHARLLKRFCNKVVLVFDGDAAGQKAAERSLQTLLTTELDVRVLVLPAGQDPDEFLQNEGVEALRGMIDGAAEAWRWAFDVAADRHGMETLDGRNRVLDEMLAVVSGVPSDRNPRVQMLLSTLSSRLGLSEEVVRGRLKNARTAQSSRSVYQGATAAPQQPSRVRVAVDNLLAGRRDEHDLTEQTLIEELLTFPEHFASVRAEVPPEDFRNIALGKLFRAMDAVAQDVQPESSMDHGSTPNSGRPTFAAVMAKLTHPDLKRLLVVLEERADARRSGSDPPEPTRVGSPPDACPPSLRRPVDRMQWRREEQSHRQLSRRLHTADPASRPEDVDDALMKVAQFQHRRASGPA